jgi:hypothetical protein
MINDNSKKRKGKTEKRKKQLQKEKTIKSTKELKKNIYI